VIPAWEPNPTAEFGSGMAAPNLMDMPKSKGNVKVRSLGWFDARDLAGGPRDPYLEVVLGLRLA
jgi:hypothetical protein